MFSIKSIFIIFFFSFIMEDVRAKSVCVLSFFEKESKEETMVKESFNHAFNTQIFHRPGKNEINYCLTQNYDEVLWLSHSSLMGFKNKLYYPIMIDKNSGLKIRLFKRWFSQFLDPKVVNAKKLRIAFCGLGSQAYKSTMDGFLTGLEERNILIDKIERADFASKLLEKDVVELTYDWLSQSIEKRNLKTWKTDSNHYCRQDFWPGCDRQSSKYVLPLRN